MAVPGYCDQVMSLHVPVAFPFELQVSRLYRVFLPGPGQDVLVHLRKTARRDAYWMRFVRRPVDTEVPHGPVDA
jgi:hypothetical protein